MPWKLRDNEIKLPITNLTAVSGSQHPIHNYEIEGSFAAIPTEQLIF